MFSQTGAANNAFTSFNWGTDPDGNLASGYSIAGVSDGSKLSLYLRDLTSLSGWNLIAQTDLTGSASPNTALSAGAGDGGDWDWARQRCSGGGNGPKA